MKTLIASIFALSLLGATAASADVGVGLHVGGVGAGVHLDVGGRHHHDRYYHRHCRSWGWYRHHRDRYCRRWY